MLRLFSDLFQWLKYTLYSCQMNSEHRITNNEFRKVHFDIQCSILVIRHSRQASAIFPNIHPLLFTLGESSGNR